MQSLKIHLISAACLTAVFAVPAHLLAKEGDSKKDGKTSQDIKTPLMQGNSDKLPTYIKSDTLTLKSEERIFTYLGNVEVKHGDTTLTSQSLEGKYGKDNKIEQLLAKDNVVIVKGDSIRANGERAIYDATAETVVLTENPELQQKGSILTADLIKIFLKDNRSEAQGAVRVKVIKDPSADSKDGSTDLKSLIRNK